MDLDGRRGPNGAAGEQDGVIRIKAWHAGSRPRFYFFFGKREAAQARESFRNRSAAGW